MGARAPASVASYARRRGTRAARSTPSTAATALGLLLVGLRDRRGRGGLVARRPGRGLSTPSVARWPGPSGRWPRGAAARRRGRVAHAASPRPQRPGWSSSSAGPRCCSAVLGLVHIANGLPRPADGDAGDAAGRRLRRLRLVVVLADLVTSCVAVPLLVLLSVFGLLVVTATPLHAVPEQGARSCAASAGASRSRATGRRTTHGAPAGGRGASTPAPTGRASPGEEPLDPAVLRGPGAGHAPTARRPRSARRPAAARPAAAEPPPHTRDRRSVPSSLRCPARRRPTRCRPATCCARAPPHRDAQRGQRRGRRRADRACSSSSRSTRRSPASRRGPTVTRYEVELGPASRSSGSPRCPRTSPTPWRAPTCGSCRPIPGKSAIGIEIPNTDRETVVARRRAALAASPRSDHHPMLVGARQGRRGRLRRAPTSRRCRTCSSPARPAPASRAASTR